MKFLLSFQIILSGLIISAASLPAIAQDSSEVDFIPGPYVVKVSPLFFVGQLEAGVEIFYAGDKSVQIEGRFSAIRNLMTGGGMVASVEHRWYFDPIVPNSSMGVSCGLGGGVDITPYRYDRIGYPAIPFLQGSLQTSTNLGRNFNFEIGIGLGVQPQTQRNLNWFQLDILTYHGVQFLPRLNMKFGYLIRGKDNS